MRNVFIYIAVLLMVLSACGSSKKVANMSDIKHFEMKTIYDSIIANYGDYSTVSMKFSVDSKSLLKLLPVQVKGSIRIKRDSAVWISITPALGIEVFRCLITQDSVKYKIQKKTEIVSIDSLNSLIGYSLDYNTLQSILLNEIFFCEQKPIDTLNYIKNFDVSKNDFRSSSKREYKKSSTIQFLQKWAINHAYRISNVEIIANVDDKSNKINLDYSNFETFENVLFPTKLEIRAKTPNAKNQLILEYSKIRFNENLSFPFNVRSK